jgi:hypothetical protein
LVRALLTTALPPQNRMRLAGLPAQALEFRDEMLLPRKADAKICDERPGAWNVEHPGYRVRIENRHPADAETAGARGKPERMERANGRIAARFGHGARTEAMALLGRLIAKDRELDRRIAQARELEPGVKRRALAGVVAERVVVGRLEIGPDRRAARLIIHAHEPGRLAIADRRGERGEVEELGQHRLVRRFLGAKMPHVAAPGEKVGESRPECGVKLGRFAEGMGQFRHRHFLVPDACPLWHNSQEAESAKGILRFLRLARHVARGAARSGAPALGHRLVALPAPKARVGSFTNCAVLSRLETSLRRAARPRLKGVAEPVTHQRARHNLPAAHAFRPIWF